MDLNNTEVIRKTMYELLNDDRVDEDWKRFLHEILTTEELNYGPDQHRDRA
jgi:hypothetical protein